MPVRLRYLARDIDLPEGQFLVGRTGDCNLALDDPLVSRRHALITVQTDGIFVHDLGSRNGVFLNGVRIDKPETLREGDQIRIGSQDLVVHTLGDLSPPSSEGSGRAFTSTLQDVRVADLLAEGDFADERTSVATHPVPSVDKRSSALAIIGPLADKAFAMGRAEEAERLLQRILNDALTRAQAGDANATVAEEASIYAARLAGATGKGLWIDYVFKLYIAHRALVPARIVDELYAVVRKVKHTDKVVLRAYTACLREIAGGFGPADRFIQQRIEGFERWAP